MQFLLFTKFKLVSAITSASVRACWVCVGLKNSKACKRFLFQFFSVNPRSGFFLKYKTIQHLIWNLAAEVGSSILLILLDSESLIFNFCFLIFLLKYKTTSWYNPTFDLKSSCRMWLLHSPQSWCQSSFDASQLLRTLRTYHPSNLNLKFKSKV